MSELLYNILDEVYARYFMNFIKLHDGKIEFVGFPDIPSPDGYITVKQYGSRLVIVPGRTNTGFQNSFFPVASKTVEDDRLSQIMRHYFGDRQSCCFYSLMDAYYQDTDHEVPAEK